MIINYYSYVQLICTIVAIVNIKSLRKYKLGGFIPLMLVVCGVELFNSNRVYFGWTTTYFLGNIFLVLSTPLYLYIFYRVFEVQKKVAGIYIVISCLSTLLILLNYFFFQGPAMFNTLSMIYEQLLTIVLSVGLLFKIATDEQYIIFKKDPYFWIASGLLIFSLGTLVLLGMQQYILLNKITINNKSIYRVLMPVFNIILYSAYTYAFYLCTKPKKKLY